MIEIDLDDLIWHLVNNYFPYELEHYGASNKDGMVEQLLAQGMGWA